MAQRTISRALAVGVIASAIMSAAVPAHAQDDQPAAPKKGCVIEYVDDNGKTIGKKTVPHGTKLGGGIFTCNDGAWEFFGISFNAVVSGTADTVVVDVKEQVKDVIGVQVDTREGQIQVQEMLSVVQLLYGEEVLEPGGAIVMDSYREEELTADELAALFDGREVPGVRVLATTQPDLKTTLNELGELGGDIDDGSGVLARKMAIRLGRSNYWFVGTIKCHKARDGSKECDIVGDIVKR